MKYKNVPVGEFKSNLERTAAQLLQQWGLLFEYEPWTVVLADSFLSEIISYERIGKNYKQQRFKVQPISYTPDFVGDAWIIETKGKKTPDFILKWKLFKKHLAENGLKFTLFMPTNKREIIQSIEIIKTITQENGKDERSTHGK